MDELDLLKKDWKRQDKSLPHLSYNEIYKLIWKKSSSIVKWIFIISILEFLLGSIMNIVVADEEYWEQMEEYHLTTFIIIMYTVNYAITIFFIVKFYLNYKRISTTDSASRLMSNILKTRKTVKHYIAFILISSALTFLLASWFILKTHVSNAPDNPDMQFDVKQWIIFVGAMLIILALILTVVWLFYKLIYGILLKRLKANYKELKKLDV